MSQIYLQREYQLQCAAKTKTLRLTIAPPRPDPLGDWSCSVELKVEQQTIKDKAYGIDGLQCLNIAINQLVPLKLEQLAEQYQAQLLFLEHPYTPKFVEDGLI